MAIGPKIKEQKDKLLELVGIHKKVISISKLPAPEVDHIGSKDPKGGKQEEIDPVYLPKSFTPDSGEKPVETKQNVQLPHGAKTIAEKNHAPGTEPIIQNIGDLKPGERYVIVPASEYKDLKRRDTINTVIIVLAAAISVANLMISNSNSNRVDPRVESELRQDWSRYVEVTHRLEALEKNAKIVTEDASKKLEEAEIMKQNCEAKETMHKLVFEGMEQAREPTFWEKFWGKKKTRSYDQFMSEQLKKANKSLEFGVVEEGNNAKKNPE